MFINPKKPIYALKYYLLLCLVNPYILAVILSSINTLTHLSAPIHIARHTFATTVTLSQGVPIESVSKMLGHTNIKTTQIYARITNQKISRDMEALAEKMRAKQNAVVDDDREYDEF